MARRKRLLILAGFGLGFAAVSGAENAGKPETPERRERREARRAEKSPEFDNVRKALEALTPEQRKRFQENFLRWSNLPPEEKKALRDRDEWRKKRIREGIDQAIKESGLSLNEAQREAFAKRYVEGRRKLEEQLRREIDEKRKPLLNELVGRLKEEFSKAGDSAGPAPAAAVQTPEPAP